MEVRPEFREVRHNMRCCVIGLDMVIVGLMELHQELKDDRIVDLLMKADVACNCGYKVNHWFYQEHQEEAQAYDNEIYSQVSDFQHD